MLHINDLTYRIGERLLIDHATVALPTGAKVGLVGKNGAGKTTLFKLIAGEIGAETGGVSRPKNSRIGQVAQEAPGGPETLISVVMAADLERAALLAEAETAHDAHRIAEIHTRLADIESHSAESRAASILAGLGFDEATQNGPCSALSGGWRMRVALAATLFTEPDILLLDEPTNYLDLEGTLWLENFIARYRHTVVMISHDRDLLNRAVDTIVHLDQGKLTLYRGNYDSFDRQRRERQALQQKAKKKQDDQRAHMQAFVDRFRYTASKARQAQSRLKMLERMEPIAAMADDTMLPFSFPDPARPAAPPIIQMEDASVGYEPGHPVLRKLDLRIDDDDRIGLLGSNGNGKSTLAKLLAGRMEPMGGRIRRLHRLEVAFFAQHQLDELNPAASAYDHVRELMPDAFEAQVRARTGAMGFTRQKMETPAKDLSGGEKARLLLGLATFTGPNLMILDEPTNHLDIDSREALVMALAEYKGAVILISHDRHLLEASVDRLWLVAEGTVHPFDGDLNDYRTLVLEGRGGRSSGGGARVTGSGQDRRRASAKRREESAPLRKKIKDAETAVAKLQAEIAALDKKLADPKLYQRPMDAAFLAKERADLVRSLTIAEDKWLAASTAAEEAAAAE
ncbi:MAG: ABC-F family ATP-binding cassette domain-containing protein [Bauldia sp.]